MAIVTLVLIAILGLTGYVLLGARRDLMAARDVLSLPAAELESRDIEQAEAGLARARDRLEGVAASVLRPVPVIGENIQALSDVTRSTLGVLDPAEGALNVLERFERSGALQDGAVDLRMVETLIPVLDQEARALRALEREVTEEETGWLLPPVWDAFEELRVKAAHLAEDATAASQVSRIAPAMLGAEGDRTYLVMLLNNAEARGAGGILSGLGTISARDGEIDVGKFHYYADLAEAPYERVASPADFERRFSRQKADTTWLVNTTMSPDVPDVALVASRLYKKVTGIETDGALLIDPRGIAALLPEGTEVPVPSLGTTLTAEELPAFVYSDAYLSLGGPDPARRDALLEIGAAGLDAFLDAGLKDRAAIERAQASTSSGHIRFVSFERDEASALEAAGMSDDFAPPRGDSMFVTAQNFGGDKLDYWTTRSYDHSCSVVTDAPTACSTAVEIGNVAPEGLPEYVLGGKKTALLETLTDVYVPAGADVTRVTLDGEPVKHYQEPDEGHTAVGVYLELPPGEKAEVRVDYQLPDSAGYSLDVVAHPLTADATITLDLELPEGWVVDGPGTWTDDTFSFTGPLDRDMAYDAHPAEATEGLPRLWDSLRNFLNEPVGL